MEHRRIGIVVAVYNRPEELEELLASLLRQSTTDFCVVVVEDGSTRPSDEVCARYASSLTLVYLKQENTGPALARNHGVAALGQSTDYILFVDSDCTLPPHYLASAEAWLDKEQGVVDLWGGPDAWDENFTPIQKAISYAMTSPYSTGGIRGGGERSDKFYPRTFNMGVRTRAFEAVGGFANLRYGEDVDLSMRLCEAGYRSALQRELFVYHKRRTSWRSFFRQVYHSGQARRMLAERHPGTLRWVHLLPSAAILLGILWIVSLFVYWKCVALGVVGVVYGLVVARHAYRQFRSLPLALRSVWACGVMVLGYGFGLWSTLGRRRRGVR